jgi:hypothetical protein
MLQQKQLAYETRRQEQKKYEEHMKMMELQNRKDEEEILRIAQNLDRMALMENKAERVSLSTGQSEPTTPPELRDGPFGRSKVGLSAATVLATPPSINNRPEQQPQLITPPADEVLSLLSQDKKPATRRNSDEDKFSGTPTQPPIGQRTHMR